MKRSIFISALVFALYLHALDAQDTVWAGAPDPLSPATVVRFTLIREEPVTIEVFDSTGMRVRKMFSGRQKAGQHEIPWFGDNDKGRPVASGAYQIHYSVGGKRVMKRIVIIQ
jgi:flagellar hook assembly protein FlgD